MNSEVEELIGRWNLIHEFKLPPESNVVVIGAYRGLAMAALDELYHPAQVIGYEPQMWAAQESITFLRGHFNCAVIPFGLWAGTAPAGNIPMGEYHTDGCSFVNVDSREQGVGHAMDADIALSTLDFANKIDLVICNTEGYEYQLIPYLREKGWLKKIDRLAVQWHWFLEKGLDPQKMDEEIDKLSEDYKLVIDERPAWSYHVKVNV